MTYRCSLLLPILLAACSTAPWVCTPDTCVSIATRDLPPQVAGVWLAADGSAMQVAFFMAGEDGPVVPTTATLVGNGAHGTWGSNSVRTFDGRVLLVEERLSDDRRSPRAFYRMWVEGDRLQLAAIRIEHLVAATNSSHVRLRVSEDRKGVVYADPRGMAATLTLLLEDPEAWQQARVYTRANVGADASLLRG